MLGSSAHQGVPWCASALPGSGSALGDGAQCEAIAWVQVFSVLVTLSRGIFSFQ